jgi:AcrR family transcriptional regulator
MSQTISQPAGQRGPAAHERRTQILEAANAHFRTYGYEKTTVADLAKAIGVSGAYIYKFFDSKQSIGEAICAQSLGRIVDQLRLIVESPKPAAARLRLIYTTVARRGADLCFLDRRLHDLAVIACGEKWPVVAEYQTRLAKIVRGVISQGRRNGEFERKTSIAETSAAVMLTLDLFSFPTMLMHNIDDPEGKAMSVVNLVLRSLAP